MNTNTNHTMTPNTPTKKEIKAARRKLKQVHKLLGEICELTGRNRIAVSHEITRAEHRPPAPPSSDTSMTPAEFRELGLGLFDRLLIASCFPLDWWIGHGEDLTYATIGSGDNEVFISPPRLLSTMLKPEIQKS
jgi:hypothetical protein